MIQHSFMIKKKKLQLTVNNMLSEKKNKLQIICHHQNKNGINLYKHEKNSEKIYIKLLEGLKVGKDTTDFYIV